VVDSLLTSGEYMNGFHEILLSYADLANSSEGVTIPYENGLAAGLFGPVLGYFLGGGAAITINTNSSTSFGQGYVPEVAATILHELGHAYNLTPGSGGSSIAYDVGNPTASLNNDSLIRNNCGQ
jgi:hypothetical protein